MFPRKQFGQAAIRRVGIFALAADHDRLRQLPWDRHSMLPLYFRAWKDVDSLPGMDCAAFVISGLSSCSTMFQEAALYAAATLPGHVPRWVLKLDPVEIPLGFAPLRDYPLAPRELTE